MTSPTIMPGEPDFGAGMTGVTEKLLEDEITSSLLASGGYLAVRACR